MPEICLHRAPLLLRRSTIRSQFPERVQELNQAEAAARISHRPDTEIFAAISKKTFSRQN